MGLNIIHTSDWHLGKMLYGKKRDDEFEQFLSWLAQTMHERKTDILLMAGDVFDTHTPSHRAQSLYYEFLCQIAQSDCRHVVIIGGNHDSPSFLNAPKDILKSLNIHIVGQKTDNPEDEILILKNHNQEVELIVCAVPYLRDKDIRLAQSGETWTEKEQKIQQGIAEHYQNIIHLAEEKRAYYSNSQNNPNSSNSPNHYIPLIAMGHLFIAGGQMVEGDGVRDLYIGSLGQVGAHIFPENVDYVALGHLHVPQKVAGLEHIRYCGSPIAMGFGEAKQQKIICELIFNQDNNQDNQNILSKLNNKNYLINIIDIPVFQKLEQIKGNWQEISSRISELIFDLKSQTQTQIQSKPKKTIWLEIIYQGDKLMSDLREKLHQLIQHHDYIEILRIKNHRINPNPQILSSLNNLNNLDNLNLKDLDIHQVFQACLDSQNPPLNPTQQTELKQTYQEIIYSLNQKF